MWSLFRPILLSDAFADLLLVHRGDSSREAYREYEVVPGVFARPAIRDQLGGLCRDELMQLGLTLLAGPTPESTSPRELEGRIHEALCRELEDPLGRLVLLRAPPRSVRPPPAAPEEAPIEQELANDETAWIEIHLVDEEGDPVSGVEYEIKLPDGSHRVGRTNEVGVIYYANLTPGSCEFSLTSLDQSAWEPA